VVPVPGASAAIAALAASGLPTDRFLFLGFPPARSGARRRFLQEVAQERGTLVLYEAPHRLMASLKDILATLGDRRIAVGRELTKFHEGIFRGTVSEAVSHFDAPRGEFTLVIEGSRQQTTASPTAGIGREMKDMRRRGKTAKEAIDTLTGRTGLSRKQLYRLWVEQTRA